MSQLVRMHWKGPSVKWVGGMMVVVLLQRMIEVLRMVAVMKVKWPVSSWRQLMLRRGGVVVVCVQGSGIGSIADGGSVKVGGTTCGKGTGTSVLQKFALSGRPLSGKIGSFRGALLQPIFSSSFSATRPTTTSRDGIRVCGPSTLAGHAAAAASAAGAAAVVSAASFFLLLLLREEGEETVTEFRTQLYCCELRVLRWQKKVKLRCGVLLKE